METTVQKQSKETVAINHAKSMINVRVCKLDLQNNVAIVELRVKAYRAKKWRVKMTEVRITKKLVQWFMYQRPFIDDEGKDTGLYLTGYQRWLLKNERDINTPITEVDFSCENGSENYYDNPFRISIYNEFNSATMTLVYMAKMKVVSRHNPVTGETTRTWIYKRNKDGRILTLPKKYFMRLEVK